MDSSTVLGNFTYGIYLITIRDQDKKNGMVASWVTQCSNDPPLVIVTIKKDRLSNRQIIRSGKFCINVLEKRHKEIISQFKISDTEKKFDNIDCSESPSGLPVFDEALGWLECEVRQTVETGDHTVFISRIVEGKTINKGIPLSSFDYEGNYQGKE